jgi:carboxyl-terminal processing protease
VTRTAGSPAGPLLGALLLAALPCAPAAAPGSDLPEELRLETFEIVWTTVRDKHFDPGLNGVDWDGVRERYLPLASGTAGEAEFHALLGRMVSELGQSHFQVIAPDTYFDVEDTGEAAGGAGRVGIEVRWVEERAAVTRVEPGSSGALAGLRPGAVIASVGGTTTRSLAESVRAMEARPGLEEFLLVRAVAARLRGEPGSRVKLGLRGAGRRTLRLERREPAGEPVAFANLPPIHAREEHRLLEGNVGYLRFNVFLMPLLDPIRLAVDELAGADALVLDLRGNPGGVGGMAMAVARLFHRERSDLGAIRFRNFTQRLLVFPAEEAFDGPMAILADEATASTSEILAAGMQAEGRAVIVGRRTSGQVLPSLVEILPTGARLQYAVADYVSPDGTLLEGSGVEPDVPVTLTLGALREGRDPDLEAAVEALRRLRPAAAAR